MKTVTAAWMTSLALALCALAMGEEPFPAAESNPLPAADEPFILAQYGAGAGPRVEGDIYHLLDDAGTKHQANTIGFALLEEGASAKVDLAFRLRVTEGGEGGFVAFLDTREHAAQGPAPYLPSLEAPGFRGSFAVGIDVSNPKSTDWFRGPGNFYGFPEREISLHWDGREIVKRRAGEEFRGEEFVAWNLSVAYVVGGAEITVRFADCTVYDRYFIPGMQPCETRLAMGARTAARTAAGTGEQSGEQREERIPRFDVKEPTLTLSGDAPPAGKPVGFNLFNYVQTTQAQSSFTSELDLPPKDWAYGRLVMKIRIHGGSRWDEWDRCGDVSVETEEGTVLKVVSFITSYLTPCYWEVDVTDFRPLLSGRTKFILHAGTIYKDKGFLLSVDLDYYPGRPERHPFRIVPLWCGTVRYQSDETPFGGFYDNRSVAIDGKTTAARLHLVHTGHSQVGEFTPAARSLHCNDAVFENVLWRDDCYLNPNRPQFGTWKFARAGWAPGDVCHPWLIDVTGCVEPGKEALFRYVPRKYEFGEGEERPGDKALAAASHNVSSYLILYEDPARLVDAPTVLIFKVTPKSAAQKAGLKAGDYLFSYDGVRLASRDDVDRAKKAALAAGKETVTLVAYRGSERLEIEFPTGQMGVSLGSS